MTTATTSSSNIRNGAPALRTGINEPFRDVLSRSIRLFRYSRHRRRVLGTCATIRGGSTSSDRKFGFRHANTTPMRCIVSAATASAAASSTASAL
jgi:hypothetical protein